MVMQNRLLAETGLSPVVQIAAERHHAAALGLLSAGLLLPSTIFYLFRTSSQAPGLGIAALLIVGAGMIGLTSGLNLRQWTSAVVALGFLALVLVMHAMVASLFEPVAYGRVLSSLALFSLMLLGSVALSRSLFGLRNEAIAWCVAVFMALFLLIAIAAIFGIQPPNVGGYFKRLFPFTEPSHYALTFTPLLLAFCVNSNLPRRCAALVIVLLIAYLIESLSLVVGTLLVAALCLPTAWTLVAGTLIFAVVGVLDLSYFTDRLDLSQSNSNLSVLVYIQGWDLAGEGIARTNGWGLGFQQLGLGNITTYTSSLIVALAGGDANLRDGGFTLAKLIGELGVLGLALITAYGFALVRAMIVLRQIALRKRAASAGLILALAFVCGYSIEAFVRGIGYFSGTTMLMIAALLFLMQQRFFSRR